MRKSSSFVKTWVIVVGAVVVSVYASYLLQSQAAKMAIIACSYLDPVGVDMIALVIGMFLIVEGANAIVQNRHQLVRSHLTRCARICIGFSILVIHIMQFIHK